jgi:hypothetical protein
MIREVDISKEFGEYIRSRMLEYLKENKEKLIEELEKL